MKVRLAMLTVCMALLGSACSAQIVNRLNFGVGAGFTTPTGDAGNNLNAGWNLDLRGGLNVNHYLEGDLDFTYDHWNLNSAALARFGEPDGHVGFWTLTFNPVVKLALKESRLQPYGTAGYGLYHRNLTLTRPAVVPTLFCDHFSDFVLPSRLAWIKW